MAQADNMPRVEELHSSDDDESSSDSVKAHGHTHADGTVHTHSHNHDASDSSSDSDTDSDSRSVSSDSSDNEDDHGHKRKEISAAAEHRAAKAGGRRARIQLGEPKPSAGPSRGLWIGIVVIVVGIFALRFLEEKYDFAYDEFVALYTDLELTASPSLSMDEIRRAHHTLAKKYHPDKCSTEECQTKYVRILHAYDTLKEHHVVFWERQALLERQKGQRQAQAERAKAEQEERERAKNSKAKPRNN